MKYLVTGNIKHDGKPLKVGSVVEFDESEGDRLMAGGYLATVPVAAKSDDGSKKPDGKAK